MKFARILVRDLVNQTAKFGVDMQIRRVRNGRFLETLRERQLSDTQKIVKNQQIVGIDLNLASGCVSMCCTRDPNFVQKLQAEGSETDGVLPGHVTYANVCHLICIFPWRKLTAPPFYLIFFSQPIRRNIPSAEGAARSGSMDASAAWRRFLCYLTLGFISGPSD